MELIGDGARPERVQAAINNVRLQVNPDNILKVRKVFLDEAARIREFLQSLQSDGQYVGLCGGDPLSIEAARAFNRRIDRELRQARRYGEQLEAAGRSLEKIARDYGYTEAQIRASFNQPGQEQRL